MKDELLKKLYESRKIASDEEFKVFDETLSEISELVTEEDIPTLCNILDDLTEDEEVLFGIVHLIEKFDSQEAFNLTVIGIKNIAKSSPRWAKIILYRCLNDNFSRSMLKNALSLVDSNANEEVIRLLKQIKEEDSEKFSNKILEII